MLRLAWASVLFIVTLPGSASQSQLTPFQPNFSIPLDCVISIYLVDWDLGFGPQDLRKAAVTQREAYGQVVVAK